MTGRMTKALEVLRQDLLASHRLRPEDEQAYWSGLVDYHFHEVLRLHAGIQQILDSDETEIAQIMLDLRKLLDESEPWNKERCMQKVHHLESGRCFEFAGGGHHVQGVREECCALASLDRDEAGAPRKTIYVRLWQIVSTQDPQHLLCFGQPVAGEI